MPCGPVNTIDAVLSDPRFQKRGMFLQDVGRRGEPVIVNTPVIADGVIFGEMHDEVITE